MKTKSLRQQATIKAKPSEIYELLMDSKKHGKFTGAPAKIENKAGGKFSVHDGYIGGSNVKLIKNKKIVQMWRAKGWPDGHYSIATFNLKPVKGGTRIDFYQSGIPSDAHTSIKSGWISHYWIPMKKTLEK